MKVNQVKNCYDFELKGCLIVFILLSTALNEPGDTEPYKFPKVSNCR